MRYIWNDSKQFCGILYTNIASIGTDKPIKPLRQGEKAIWNGEDWEYEFENHELKEEKEITYKDFDFTLRGLPLCVVQPENGEETRKHTGEISILIPCYNKKDFIKETAESAINQTQKPLHVIILLMGEDICMKSELEEMGCECIIHDRLNASDARTYLVSVCPTDWFIFLDADDTLEPNFIEVLDKDDGAICFSAEKWMKSKVFMGHNARNDSLQHLLSYNMTCLMHKDVFLDIGLNSSLGYGGEDFDFICRLLQMKKYKITRNVNTWFYYREWNGENLVSQDGFFESIHEADKMHASWLREELEKNKAAEGYAGGKYYLDYMDDLSTLSWWMPWWLKDYQSLAEVKLKRRIENKFKSLFELSRQKTPKGVYTNEDFAITGNMENIDYFPEIELENRAFDCIFVGRIDWDNAFSILGEKPLMILRKDILEEIKNLNEYKRMEKLLSEYNCFEVGCDWLKEKTEIDTTVSLVKDEEDFKEICRGYENGRSYPVAPRIQRASFSVSHKCNKKCAYCAQFLSAKDCLEDEEETLKNLEDCLKKAEEICEKNGTVLLPAITGGEPTFWSESLQKGILEKMKKYKRWELFTNGYDLSSPLVTCPNAELCIHIIDWKNGDFLKTRYEACVSYVIILNKGDAKDYRKFLELYKQSKFKLKVIARINTQRDLAATEDDIKEFLAIEKEFFENFSLIMCNNLTTTLEDPSDSCRNDIRTWSIDCQTRKAMPCCEGGVALEEIPLEDFTGERIKECDGCKLWIHNASLGE